MSLFAFAFVFCSFRVICLQFGDKIYTNGYKITQAWNDGFHPLYPLTSHSMIVKHKPEQLLFNFGIFVKFTISL